MNNFANPGLQIVRSLLLLIFLYTGSAFKITADPVPLLLNQPAKESSSPPDSTDAYFSSPYDEVDWEWVQMYKMDSHAHARRGASVGDVLRFYEGLGYGAVSFKEDGRLEYPIEDHVRNPEEFRLTLLPGQGIKPYRDEEPYEQHLKFWFSEKEYGEGTLEFEEAFEVVGEDGGLLVFVHPASGIYPMYSVNVGADWYIDYFDRYPHLVGIEINNHDMQGNLGLFDELLSHYGSERLVVGFGTSDLFGPDEDGNVVAAGGFGLSLVISEDNRKETLREAIEAGRILWIATETPGVETQRVRFPRIDSIRVNNKRIHIHMADEYDRIEWIYEGNVIHTGETFFIRDRVDASQNYVRFEISDGEGATVGSQAFYIMNH